MNQLIDLLFIVKNRFLTWLIVLIYDLPQKRQIINSDEPLSKYGFQTLHSSDLFGSSISEIAKYSGLTNLNYDSNGLYFSSKVPDKIIEIILVSSKLEQLVFSYLGENARLDDIYIKCQAPNSKSISEGWHTDNVGYRLKMFIAFDANVDSPKTILVPKTHLKIYSFSFKEIFSRFILKNNLSFFKKFINDNFKVHKNEVKLSYTDDTINIFDTNALHRGDYAEYSNSRNCIVIEFINKKKANRIYKYSPCGPGQQENNKIIFSKNLSNILKNSSLIDKGILHEKKDSNGNLINYVYSIK